MYHARREKSNPISQTVMVVAELNEPPSGVDNSVNVVSKLVEVRRYTTRLRRLR